MKRRAFLGYVQGPEGGRCEDEDREWGGQPSAQAEHLAGRWLPSRSSMVFEPQFPHLRELLCAPLLGFGRGTK